MWMLTTDDRGFVKYWQCNFNNVHTFQAHSDPVKCCRLGSLSPTSGRQCEHTGKCLKCHVDLEVIIIMFGMIDLFLKKCRCVSLLKARIVGLYIIYGTKLHNNVVHCDMYLYLFMDINLF